MKPKFTWKVWVFILTLISMILLLVVAKLIYDKSVEDKNKVEAQKYLVNIEQELKVEHFDLNNLKWSFIRNQTVPRSTHNQKLHHYKNKLKHIRNYITKRFPWMRFNNSSVTARKFKIVQEILSQDYGLSEGKYFNLEEIKAQVSLLRENTFLRARRIKQSTIPIKLPQFLPAYCKTSSSSFVGPEIWNLYFELIGSKIFSQFSPSYSNLIMEAGIVNQFSSPNEYFISSEYEMSLHTVDQLLLRIWHKLQPLYLEFHAHLRGELRLYFLNENVESNGTIPFYFLNPISENHSKEKDCSFIYELTKPYPGKQDLNLRNELKREKYTTKEMATDADNYIGSIGLPIASQNFWSEFILLNNSFDACSSSELLAILIPTVTVDHQVEEFRIKFCSSEDEGKNFASINKLMIQRSLQSIVMSNQLFLNRFPVTPALESALENSIYKTMLQQPYLQRMGLLMDYKQDTSSTLNKLYKELFEIFPKLTRALVYHNWFNEIYFKKIKATDYNTKWWLIKKNIEGTSLPHSLIEKVKFGPGDYENLIFTPGENLREFFTIVLSYEFYLRLCQLASQDSPIQNESGSLGFYNFITTCDFSGKPVIGNIVKEIMKHGSSKPWFKILETIGIRIDDIDGTALLEYFSPLHQYLKEINRKRELPIGW